MPLHIRTALAMKATGKSVKTQSREADRDEEYAVQLNIVRAALHEFAFVACDIPHHTVGSTAAPTSVYEASPISRPLNRPAEANSPKPGRQRSHARQASRSTQP